MKPKITIVYQKHSKAEDRAISTLLNRGWVFKTYATVTGFPRSKSANKTKWKK